MDEILVMHEDGDILLMQRDYNKPNSQGLYEASAGTETIYEGFPCITDVPKDSITLQEGETIACKWISSEEFRSVYRTDKYMRSHSRRPKEFVEDGF